MLSKLRIGHRLLLLIGVQAALLLAAVLVVVLPLLLLVGIVAVGAIVVVAGLALGRAAIDKLRRAVRGDGRSNVRVIQRTGGSRADE